MNDTATAAGTGRALKARYKLHERLGSGGQGEVWRAHDPERGEDIAIKILRPAQGRSGAAWEALLHEYDSASRLDHPHVLKVYPPEREEGTFLLPMELASGGDLRRLRGAGYLAIVPVLIEVARALEHAHEHGVIHRDLKPGNVLFDARGRVKLADFGVSGLAPDPGTDALIRGLSPFTSSPEQLRGEPPAPSDDVYGLGALAYELLSRYPPHFPHFDARRVQQEPVPPLVPTEPMPSQLDALISRMLAKDARQRPALPEVIEELEASLHATLTFESEILREDLASTHNLTMVDPEAASLTLPPDELPLPAPEVAGERPARTVPLRSVAPPAPLPPITHATEAPALPAMAAAAQARAAAQAPAAAPPPMPMVAQSPAAASAPTTMAAAAPAAVAALVASPGAPGGRDPAALDGPKLWEELRETPIPVSRLEPMRDRSPWTMTILLTLAAAGGAVAFFFFLPRELAAPVPAVSSIAPQVGTAPPPAATPLPGTPSSLATAPPPASPPESASPAETPGVNTPAPSAARKPKSARPPAVAASAQAVPAFGDDSYARAAGEGFAALGAGRLDEARAAFERAHALRPDGAEALDGLRRVAAAAGVPRTQATDRAHAEDLEAQERWREALGAYSAMLRRNGTLAFAQAGRARAAERLELSESLQALIDAPEQLSSPRMRDEAADLVRRAEAQPSPGPVLRSQIKQLTALLPGLEEPVHLALVSDSLTQVAIPSVGDLGSFARRDLELKPGRYTVIGTREGYRDVRRDITISPGQESQTISVRCDE
jgi:eukaryotic-like serine/threonine-protein kinase